MTRHRRRAQSHDHPNWVNAATSETCPTGKLGYPNRRQARAAVGRTSIRGEHMRPYQCETCDRWHVGHLPDDVMRGIRSADDHYQRGRV